MAACLHTGAQYAQDGGGGGSKVLQPGGGDGTHRHTRQSGTAVLQASKQQAEWSTFTATALAAAVLTAVISSASTSCRTEHKHAHTHHTTHRTQAHTHHTEHREPLSLFIRTHTGTSTLYEAHCCDMTTCTHSAGCSWSPTARGTPV